MFKNLNIRHQQRRIPDFPEGVQTPEFGAKPIIWPDFCQNLYEKTLDRGARYALPSGSANGHSQVFGYFKNQNWY